MTETKKKAAVVVHSEPTPKDLIQLAIQQGTDTDKLEKLMALQERWEANQARKQFFEALAQFQDECPVLIKDDKADFKTSKGRTTYQYATLPGIVRQIKPALKSCGLSYRWEFGDQDGQIMVCCILTHIAGHSERTTMGGPAEDSGTKNKLQSRGSSLTYLQRYTLIGALGLATAQDDVDGAQKQPAEPNVDSMSLEQQEKINRLLKDLDDDLETATIIKAMPGFTQERAQDAIKYLTGRILDNQAEAES